MKKSTHKIILDVDLLSEANITQEVLDRVGMVLESKISLMTDLGPLEGPRVIISDIIVNDPVLDDIEPSEGKYTLLLNMDTDDDCEVIYRGNSFCRYNKNLEVVYSANSKQEIKDHILNNLIVPDGYKVSCFTQLWLKECIEVLDSGGGDYPSIAGNQTYNFSILGE
tara:strand:- start:378 stop:878 length:501 start_codon:yes stop_codon:yes gene_type:complete